MDLLLQKQKRKLEASSQNTHGVVKQLKLKDFIISQPTKINLQLDSRRIVEYFNEHKRLKDIDMVKACEAFSFGNYNIEFTNDEVIKIMESFKPILDKAENKVYMLLSTLTNEQLDFISKSLYAIKNKEIVLLDAPAGTGKSFTIIILLMILSSKLKTTFSVYKHDLLNIVRLNGLNRNYVTISRLIINGFNINIYFDLFKDLNSNLEYSIFKIIALGYNMKTNFDVLIVDEYTTLSSPLCFLLVCMSKAKNIPIIFAGDKRQQNSIIKSVLHQKWNASLIPANYYCNFTIQQRMKNDEFLDLVNQLRTDVKNKEVKASLPYIYKIYLQFEKHFYMDEEFTPNIIYLSTRHVNLSKKLRRFVKKCDFGNSPYIGIKNQRIEQTYSYMSNWKFAPVLYLKEGYYYIYTYNDAKKNSPAQINREIVVLKHYTPNYIVIENDNLGEITISKKVTLDNYHLSAEYIAQLYGFFQDEYGFTPSSIRNWPIQPFFVRTLHAVQGLTLSAKMKIEICLDEVTPNSAYVAFSRIKSQENLGKIHFSNLESFMYSRYRNDGFLYNLKSSDKELLKDNVDKVNPNNYFKYTDGPFKVGYKIPTNQEEIIDNDEVDKFEAITTTLERIGDKIFNKITHFLPHVQIKDGMFINILLSDGFNAVGNKNSPYKINYTSFLEELKRLNIQLI